MTPDGLVTLSITPVVYTEGAGPEGPDELFAPPLPQAESYELPFTTRSGPPIARVVGVWHTPVDNLAAITAFGQIDVEPLERSTTSVLLRVSAQPGQQGRMRLRITVLCEVGGASRRSY